MTDNPPIHRRAVRTFVKRAGRLTTSQQRALDELPIQWNEGPNAGLDSPAIDRMLTEGLNAGDAFIGNQAGDMGHINKKVGTDGIRYFTHPRPVNHTRIGRKTANQQAWFAFLGNALHFIIVYGAGFLVYAIRNRVEQTPGKIDL